MEDTKLTLQGRERLTVEGVADIAHLDDRYTELTTAQGILRVEGRELKLRTLTPQSGQVILEGKIDGLFFGRPGEEESLWHRLWG